MDLQLSGAKALITGGTKGIGRAIANTLADEGCNVSICARNQEEVDAAVADLSGVRTVPSHSIVLTVYLTQQHVAPSHFHQRGFPMAKCRDRTDRRQHDFATQRIALCKRR